MVCPVQNAPQITNSTTNKSSSSFKNTFLCGTNENGGGWGNAAKATNIEYINVAVNNMIG